MPKTEIKMTAAQMKIALAKAWKQIEVLEKRNAELAEINSRIETLKLTIEMQKSTDQHLRDELDSMHIQLGNCDGAYKKLVSDNKLLIKKINIAWNVMGELSMGS